MRVGNFDVVLTTNECFTLAEVVSGEARLLRTADVKNLRSGPKDWMKLSLRIDGAQCRQRSVRDLRKENAETKAKEIIEASALPVSLSAGVHEAVLTCCSGGFREETEIRFEVEPAQMVPIDFDRAKYLAAWIDESDELRSFANEAAAGASGPEAQLRALYDALYAEKLMYYVVPSVVVADCERVSTRGYTLTHGGSCMCLSLLMASLIKLVGGAPVLLLYSSHITAGWLTGSADFVTEDKPDRIRELLDGGDVILTEVTGVCGNEHYRLDYDSAKRKAGAILAGAERCVLVNVLAALRKGGVCPVSQPENRVKCPDCGFDDFPNAADAAQLKCPACGKMFDIRPARPKPAARRPVVCRNVRFSVCASGCAVTGYDPAGAGELTIPEVWQDRTVTAFAASAFRESAFTSVDLPDSLSAIGEKAFMNCRKLQNVHLPGMLTQKVPQNALYQHRRLAGACRRRHQKIFPCYINGPLLFLGKQRHYSCSPFSSLSIRLQTSSSFSFSSSRKLQPSKRGSKPQTAPILQ